jgi:glycosyltransferase involved in cell wall biosynthesis
MPPLVTICVPAYQAARYLPETLASIRAQTFADWELIVTEDGSADPVENLVAAFASSVPQSVTYQTHPRNQGLPATRNTGIAAARGVWIALLDSDDLWTPDHLADLMLRARREPAAEFIHAGSVLFDSDTGRQIEIRAPTPATVRSYPGSLYLGDYSVQPSSVLLKKSLWARVGGFAPAYRYVEDREMWLRCARAGARFAFTERNTCHYRKHGSALTTHAAPMALASARVLQQHLDWNVIAAPIRQRVTAEAWISAGRLALRAAPRDARDCFSHAWQIQRSPRVAAYWLLAALFSLKPAPAASPATT